MASFDHNSNSDGLTDINITPLVDVFLVLLIIVMVSAQLLDKKALDVKIPQTTQELNAVSSKIEILELSLDEKNQFWLNDQIIPESELEYTLKTVAHIHQNSPLLVSVGQEQPYKKLIDLLEKAKKAGFNKASLQLENKGQL